MLRVLAGSSPRYWIKFDCVKHGAHVFSYAVMDKAIMRCHAPAEMQAVHPQTKVWQPELGRYADAECGETTQLLVKYQVDIFSII